MKYYLNESIKYILSEQFVLNEDASTIVSELDSLDRILYNYVRSNKESKDTSTDTENIKSISQELSALNNTLSNYKKTSTNIFDKAINKLSGQVLRSSDAAKIKGATKEVLQKVETLLDATSIAGAKVNGTATTVKDYLRQIKALAASDDVSKETLLQIKENVAKISSIINALSQKKSDDSGISKDLVTIAEDALMNVYNLKQFIKKIGGAEKFAALANADKLMLIVTTICEQQKNGKKSLSEQRQNILDFSNLTKKVIDASGITLNTDRTGSINWDDRFAKAKDKDSFWDSYYEKAWGNNGNKIRALGDPFRNQCEKLGFSEKTNPFISFIRKYIIEKNYPIGGGIYTAIHNAVATGKLSQGLLKGTVGNKINILDCKDLYTKSAKEITDYFNYFNDIYGRSEYEPNNIFSIDINNITDTDRKRKFKAIISHLNRDDKSRNQIAWLLLFNTLPFTNRGLLSIDDNAKIAVYSVEKVETMTLRSLAEAQAIAKILNPEVTNISSKAFTNDTIKALAAKMPKANISNKTQIGQWILVMLEQFLTPEAEEQILKDYPKLAEITVSPTDRVKYRKQILDLGNNMTKKQIIDILTAYENGIDGKENTKVSFK